MTVPTLPPTGVERTFGENEIIVSKTDPEGRITYANRVFLQVSGYTERELLGQPHNIVRHRDMPRCVFKLLWDTLQAGAEVFAYVVNQAKNGDHYWVLAHVTPTFSPDGRIVGYHSNRRRPRREAIEKVKPLYATLLAEEARHGSQKAGMEAAGALLGNTLAELGVEYDEFAFSL